MGDADAPGMSSPIFLSVKSPEGAYSLAPYTVTFDKLQFYTIHLNSIDSLHKREL